MGMRIIIVVHPRFLVIERTVVVTLIVVIVVVAAVKDFVCGQRTQRGSVDQQATTKYRPRYARVRMRTHRDMQTHMHT